MAWRSEIRWLSGADGEARRETEARLGDKALILTLDNKCYVARIEPGGYCVLSSRGRRLQDVCLGGNVAAMAPLEWTPVDWFRVVPLSAIARIRGKIEELETTNPELLEKVEAFVDVMLAATKTSKKE